MSEFERTLYVKKALQFFQIKFIYSEKATKFCEIFPLTFDYSTYSQKLGEDFAKFCGLLRIYELYILSLFQIYQEFDKMIKKFYCVIHTYLNPIFLKAFMLLLSFDNASLLPLSFRNMVEKILTRNDSNEWKSDSDKKMLCKNA